MPRSRSARRATPTQTARAARASALSSRAARAWAALALLNHDPAAFWKPFWPILRKEPTFAERLFTRLAINPNGDRVTRLLRGLLEDELADLAIWLSKNDDNPSPANARHSWRWLCARVLNDLVARGTSGTVAAVERIYRDIPQHGLKHGIRVAQESVRRQSWAPRSPKDLLGYVLDPAAAPDRRRSNQPIVASSVAKNSKSTEGSSSDKAIANKKVEIQQTVSVQTAATYLGCRDTQVRRLILKDILVATNTRPKQVLTTSLRSYKWPKGKPLTDHSGT